MFILTMNWMLYWSISRFLWLITSAK